MRQTYLLNVAVLVFFVYLFRSILSRRPTERLKLWIAAWVCAIAHFAIQLWKPTLPFFADLVGFIALSALALSGVCLVISSIALSVHRDRRITALGLALPTVALCAFVSFNVQTSWVILLTSLLGQALALIFLWRFYRDQITITIPGTLLILVCWQWSSLGATRHNPLVVISAILTELFLAYALLFAHEHRRRSAGVLTTLAGLIAWAAVFPTGVYLSAHPIAHLINPELWNVPKIVVAFGMLVTLLEDELTAAEREREQYRNLFDNNPLPMWIFDKDSMQLLEANSAAIREFGWTREDLTSLTIVDLVSERETSPVGIVELNWRLASDPTDVNTRVDPSGTGNARANSMRFQTRSGDDLAVEVTLQRVGFQGREARLLVTKDITAQIRAHEQLLHQANHDPLTGLPNRLLLHDRMKVALASALRHGTKAAIICVDLDRFKQINDTYGHAAGDSCLREVAARLRQRLRSVDTAARTGGEEFMIVLDGVAQPRDAERAVEDILRTLAPPLVFEGNSIQISASVGIAIYPDHAEDPSQLWNMADAAMYRAKQGGGNRHSLYSPAN